MCGRYVNTLPWSEMVELYRITEGATAAPNFPPRYNVAPTQDVPVVRLASGGGGRELALLRWGLVPSWAKDIAIGAKMINARAETVAEKPSFRSAYRSRRCLIVADGFYEWKKQAGGTKQPYHITLEGARSFAFAGLWERWEKATDGAPVETCAIVTTAANDFIAPIHGRMPVILDADAHDAWLDPTASPETTQAFLGPYRGAMEAYPVSTHVNNPRNDDAACVEALGNACERS